MKTWKMIVVLGVAPLALIGCATAPDKSELTRVEGAEVESLVVGNTVTYDASFGQWAEYYETDSTTHAKAWGNWGSSTATSTYEIEDDGTVCWTYNGDADWASPEHEYCGVFYKDAQGSYFSEVTANTSKPERVGNIRALEIKSGNANDLGG